MTRLLTVALAMLFVFIVVVACITTYNKPKITMKEGIPALERRPDGCHVEIFEDGQKVTRDHMDIGSIVLEWPRRKIQEQGPEGAIATLKAAACEHGAFIVKDMRALSTGVEAGLVYEGTLATLLENGRPLNEARTADAGPGASTPGRSFAASSETAPALNRGW